MNNKYLLDEKTEQIFFKFLRSSCFHLFFFLVKFFKLNDVTTYDQIEL